jgi:hypothetical protein
MTTQFRKLALGAFLSISALGAITMTSCTKDKTCDLGYEGSDCKTEERTKFLGTWTAADVTGSTSIPYSVAVVSGTAINAITIANTFSGSFFANPINATVTSSTAFNIPEQTPDSGSDYKVKGDGTNSNGKIAITYTITKISTGAVQSYSGVWSK